MKAILVLVTHLICSWDRNAVFCDERVMLKDVVVFNELYMHLDAL